VEITGLRQALFRIRAFHRQSESTMSVKPKHALLPLLGTWKLQSFTTEFVDTAEKTSIFGAHPKGYLSYSADGRMYAIFSAEERRSPVDLVPTDTERIDLYNGFSAYAGTFKVRGDTVIHEVDISWNEAWTGTAQMRRFRVDGTRLTIETLLDRNPVNGRDCVSTLVWLKIE
jgi:hypothetical protein